MSPYSCPYSITGWVGVVSSDHTLHFLVLGESPNISPVHLEVFVFSSALNALLAIGGEGVVGGYAV